ncbi:MAG: glycosyltransferase family 4 protein, partial [Candidatus Omnitrophica bacterium]|nr:glycosyltransferase family 4 protein [Candidatus Omnitrophota bacterium]
VLIVLTKPELGGAQKHVLSILEASDKQRYDLHLFTSPEGLLLDQLSAIPGIRLHLSRYLQRNIAPFRDIIALFEICTYIKKHRIDVVHTHSSKAGILGRLAARLTGVGRVIHTVHGWSFNDRQPFFLRRMYIGLESICARWTSVLVVVSSADRDRGLNLGIRPQSGYVLIRCGINTALFAAAVQNKTATRAALGIASSALVVGMIACFKPQKDPLAFVRLAAGLKKQLPGVRFLLVGDGVLRSDIVSFLNDNGLAGDVILTGWRTDVPHLLAAMDVMVLTSLWEGLPVVVLEAMAVGVPVVATDTKGVRDVIVPGETGELVAVGDKQAMEDKVAFLLQHRDARGRLASQARSRVLANEFSLHETVRRVQDMYDQGSQRI